jgi:hypothetical protein
MVLSQIIFSLYILSLFFSHSLPIRNPFPPRISPFSSLTSPRLRRYGRKWGVFAASSVDEPARLHHEPTKPALQASVSGAVHAGMPVIPSGAASPPDTVTRDFVAERITSPPLQKN